MLSRSAVLPPPQSRMDRGPSAVLMCIGKYSSCNATMQVCFFTIANIRLYILISTFGNKFLAVKEALLRVFFSFRSLSKILGLKNEILVCKSIMQVAYFVHYTFVR